MECTYAVEGKHRLAVSFYRAHEEARWRAGIALHAAHRFRKRLAETLSNYSTLSGETINTAHLECADSQVRRQMLKRICLAAEPIPAWVASSPETTAAALDEQIGFAHSIGWTFFAEHDSRSHSFEARQKMLLELITMAHGLDSNFKLSMLNGALAKKVATKKP